jgi:hypothetical protein
MTTYQAAQRIRKYIIERYALEGEPECNLPVVWTKQRSNESGFEWARDCVNVVWEGGFEWPYGISDAKYLGKIELPGIFIEPATGYALSIYQEG